MKCNHLNTQKVLLQLPRAITLLYKLFKLKEQLKFLTSLVLRTAEAKH